MMPTEGNGWLRCDRSDQKGEKVDIASSSDPTPVTGSVTDLSTATGPATELEEQSLPGFINAFCD